MDEDKKAEATEETVSKKEYLRVVDQQKELAGTIAQLNGKLSAFEGIDPEKVRADSARLEELLSSSKDDGAEEELEQRIQGRYQARLDELSKSNDTLASQLKSLRVVEAAMKHHGSFFVDRSQDEIRSLVASSGDYDEKAQRVVFKDAQGEVRYSTKDPSSPLSVEEFFGEIQAQRPYLAKSAAATGSMDGVNKSHKSPAKPDYSSSARASDRIRARQAELKEATQETGSKVPDYMKGLNYN